MKQAISQEALSDAGHSCIPEACESIKMSSSRVKSAAMLGIALSVGASGAVAHQAEASAAVSAPSTSEATKAFSSDSKVSAVAEAAQSSDKQLSNAPVAGYHTVESGESLWQIAQQHQVGLRELKSANELPPETAIRIGQVLKVPASERAAEEGSALLAQLADRNAAEEGVLLASTQNADSVIQDMGTVPVPSDSALTQESEATGPAPSLQIEIADASSQTESEPVVTALAASTQSFGDYQVQAGDTLASIASSLGTTTAEIINANGLTNPDVIMAGTTLRVPSTQQSSAQRTPRVAPAGKSDVSTSASVRQTRTPSEQLAYLRSTAASPDASKILQDLRQAAPTQPASVGGEPVTEQDVMASETPSEERVDPYVANLLDDVQDVNSQGVQVSEAETVQIASRAGTSSDRPSLLSRSIRRGSDERLTEQVSLSPRRASEEVSSDLLAAAPLSPDAYVPAQRPAAGQVVSPDMPILPSADEYLPEAPEYFDGYVWPAQGTLTSGYGWRWGRMHKGVDVAGPVGTTIVAAADGVVEQAGWNSGGYGNLVEIRHPDGSMTRYAHNNSLSVSAGQRVRQGQKIAEMGSTGYSTGPHLHFEVHLSGQGAVNPIAYLPNQ